MKYRVLGAVCLHYGKDYFEQALASIAKHVDEIVVYYSSTPSHGTSTRLTCPDTTKQLRDIADKFGCTWFDISGVMQENKHRQLYEQYGEKHKYDQILIIDSDEVHVSERIPELLEKARESKARRIGVSGSQWVTLWRSFNEYVTDGFAPIRVLNLRNSSGEEQIAEGFIYHMGYAIPDNLMEYKISCHGHRADFERNKSWFKDKWINYRAGVTNYLHPATTSYWIKTKKFDKTTLPQVLKDHPYYNLERIQ